jgi:hypothetical protein
MENAYSLHYFAFLLMIQKSAAIGNIVRITLLLTVT